MNSIAELRVKARADPKRVVFPEGGDKTILRAASTAAQETIAMPILLGSKDEIVALSERDRLDITGISIIELAHLPKLDEYVAAFREISDIPSGAAARILRRAIYYGAMMVRQGDADAMVAGVQYATKDVVVASELIVGLQKDVLIPSSFFLMDIPAYSGPEGSLLILADAGVTPDPSPEQLADIAITSARTAADLLGWQPRVAMLSFSTKGSASHPLVDKVIQAVELVRKRSPSLAVDGELQADAALVPEVAKRKIKGSSPVAGVANVLIFPDLNAGNIACKLLERLAAAKAYGPVLQGFVKPMSDLSRGSSVEDVLGTTIIQAVRAQRQ